MRKLAIGLLAVPVLAIVYMSTALRRSFLARTGFAIGLGAMLAFAVLATARPAPVSALPPTVDLPLTDATFRTIVATHRGLLEPVTIEFSAPMDPVSVESAVTIDPPTPVSLRWDGTTQLLTITPTTHWAPGTLHSVSVDAGALATNGMPMVSPARAAFLTRDATTGSVLVTDPIGKRMALDSSFRFVFDGPVDAATLQAGLTVDPPLTGQVVQTEARADGSTAFRFTPTTALKAATTYKLTLTGITDREGLAIYPVSASLKTIATPRVIRFRPVDHTTKVERDQAVSVRFTRPMDRASTKAAFTVSVAGKPITGTIAFAENDTVLVFDPAKLLPYGTTVTMTVAPTATSKDGAPIGTAIKGTFRTMPKPAKHAAHPPATTGGSSGGGGGGGGGGGAVGAGTWGSVETYYLGLMNCTRTGGWVTSTGHCSSPGGRNVAPLRLDAGISTHVSRPYAKKLAVGADCSHFIGGNPGDRLRRAGYTNYTWAENIGCRSGGARASVLGSHRFFQDEKSTNGGHYVNLMNAKYDRVGIGVWVSHGRVRLVIDFYHP